MKKNKIKNKKNIAFLQQVEFEFGQQKRFIDYAMQKLNFNLREMAKYFDVDYERIKKYRQGKCHIPEKFYIRVCKRCRINPKSLNISYLQRNWGQVLGGKRGFQTLKLKFGEALKLWRIKGGRNSWRFRIR